MFFKYGTIQKNWNECQMYAYENKCIFFDFYQV